MNRGRHRQRDWLTLLPVTPSRNFRAEGGLISPPPSLQSELYAQQGCICSFWPQRRCRMGARKGAQRLTWQSRLRAPKATTSRQLDGSSACVPHKEIAGSNPARDTVAEVA